MPNCDRFLQHHVGQEGSGVVLRAEGDRQYGGAEAASRRKEKDPGEGDGQGDVQGGRGYIEQVWGQVTAHADSIAER